MPEVLFKNFYDALGIGRDASADEGKKRALETHPDKLDPAASEKEKQKAERDFHRVHEAFEVLGDPIKRKACLAYDIRINARKDSSLISEEAKRRIQERKEWSQRQREESLKRIAEVNKHVQEVDKQLERERRAKEEALAKMKKDAELLAQMLKEMHQANPEFAARREAALQRKAEREALFKRTHQAVRSTS
ncbi:hypothetical protein CVT26_009903 [Gymnopilus dilepis]|uniref:J domain-containing protein n=1 Tax=Gymnopilus dilepis TaxID=231916 RepID=A0A409YBX4_9AGAR|nr:hypothetical protein CVT26_009903 [Gymnopilus dilepis]